jgi:hypothetical protein
VDITGVGVREMYYGIPITQDFDVRVNLCGGCLDKEEFKRMSDAQATAEGDDWYHFELHEKEVIVDGE